MKMFPFLGVHFFLFIILLLLYYCNILMLWYIAIMYHSYIHEKEEYESVWYAYNKDMYFTS